MHLWQTIAWRSAPAGLTASWPSSGRQRNWKIPDGMTFLSPPHWVNTSNRVCGRGQKVLRAGVHCESFSRLDGRIAGGFQILTRNSRFGSIGYISKGPVLIKEDNDLLNFMLEMVVSTVKTNRLNALILQPPDKARLTVLPTGISFLPNHLVNVISATAVVDLSRQMDKIRQPDSARIR